MGLPRSDPQQFVLEVEPGAEPIRGRIGDAESGQTREYVGWLGLIGALDELRSIGAGVAIAGGERR
jgi:hypothetical protein